MTHQGAATPYRVGMVAAPTLLHPPAHLGHLDGLTVLHWGVIDGPHGVSLVIEIVDTAGTGQLDTGEWRQPGHDLLTVTADDGGGPVTPKVVTRSSGPGWQRWTVTIDRHDRARRIDPRRVVLTVSVPHTGWTVTIPAAD